MKTRLKATAVGIIIIGMAFTSTGQSESSDLLVRFRGIGPSQDEDWDTAAGMEFQARFWQSETAGFSLAMGITSWDAVSEYLEEYDDFGYYSSVIEGDVSAIPVGGSLWFRSHPSPGLSLTLEAGLRYLIVESDIHTLAYYEDADGIFSADDIIEIDNALVSVFGLHLEAQVSDGFALQAGLGYQFDLTGPEETVLGESLGATDFSGGSFTLGAVVKF